MKSPRVLVVEDNRTIAMACAEMLANLGLTVLGPVGSTQAARELLEREVPDAALLDVSLADGFVFPLAEELRGLKVHCLLCTAFDDSLAIPPGLRDMPRLDKPYFDADLKRVLGFLLPENR